MGLLSNSLSNWLIKILLVPSRSLQDCCADLPVTQFHLVLQVSPSQKGSKQSVRSFRFTGVQLHSFTHCLHLLAGSQGGLCESSARSNASTVSCSRSRSGRRKAREQSSCHTFRFVHLPVSAGGPIIAVSTLFVEAAKSLPRAVNWS